VAPKDFHHLAEHLRLPRAGESAPLTITA